MKREFLAFCWLVDRVVLFHLTVGILLGLAGCDTLEVGIEQTLVPPEAVTSTRGLPATPEPLGGDAGDAPQATDPAAGSLPTPFPTATPSNEMPDEAITAFATTPDGALWYAFDDFDGIGGALPSSPQHGLFRSMDGRMTRFDIAGPIRVLRAAPDGSLYVGAGCRVLRYRAGGWETLLDACEQEVFDRPFVPFDLAFAEDGSLWVGGVHTLALFDGNAWIEYPVSVRRVLVAPDGSLWGEGWDGVAGSDCCFVRVTGGTWITYTHSADLPVTEELGRDIRGLLP